MASFRSGLFEIPLPVEAANLPSNHPIASPSGCVLWPRQFLMRLDLPSFYFVSLFSFVDTISFTSIPFRFIFAYFPLSLPASLVWFGLVCFIFGRKLIRLLLTFLLVNLSCFLCLTFKSLAVTLRTTRFKIKKFRMLITLHLCVLCGSQNKQQLLSYTALTGWFL